MFEELVGEWEKCKAPAKPPNWKARINKGIGTNSDCSAQRLYDAMNASKADRGYRGGHEPFVQKANSGFSWKLAACGPERFPIQAHHIIPKNCLPDHTVCAFLAKNYTDHPDVQLSGDTEYDTDHAYNGYCLPYATPLAEWGKAKSATQKDQVADALMKRTYRQLHQGSHKRYQYAPDSPAAEEEEDGDVGHADAPGYIAKIETLLDVVADRAIDHAQLCAVCKPDAGKRKISPRASVARHVHQVSGVTKALLDANRIFVSERAFKSFIVNKTNPELPDWLAAKDD